MKAVYFKWIQFFRDWEFIKNQYIEDIANFIKLIKLLYELYLIKTVRILYLMISKFENQTQYSCTFRHIYLSWINLTLTIVINYDDFRCLHLPS